jgi:hypothetical protein
VSKLSLNAIDMRPLETAQQATLAVTHTEQDYRQQALRLADHSVDLACRVAEPVKTAEADVAADQNRSRNSRPLSQRPGGRPSTAFNPLSASLKRSLL